MPAPVVRADVRFMLAHPAHLLALGFGSGLAPRAPGTFGTLFGWLLFDTLLAPWAAWGQLWVVAVGLLAAFAVGVAACERTGRDLGVADHGALPRILGVEIRLARLAADGGRIKQEFRAA